MPVPAPSVTPAAAVQAARAKYLAGAATIESLVEGAVEALVEAGALPRDRWRLLAHILFCRAIYATHVAPLEQHLTFAEIANHLDEIGVPRFRGSSGWSASAICDIRAVVAAGHNQIMLPDP